MREGKKNNRETHAHTELTVNQHGNKRVGRELDRAQDGAEPLKPQNRIQNNVTNHIVHVSIKKKERRRVKKSKMKRRASACVRARVCWISHCTLQNTDHAHTHARIAEAAGWRWRRWGSLARQH